MKGMIPMEHKCPHCGASLPENASFCPHCARSIRTREAAPVPTHMWRKGLKWVLALAIVAAAALVGWALLHEHPTGLPAGETTPVVFQEDEDGMVTATPEYLEGFFPTLTCIDFRTTIKTSDNIDDYLVDSFQMATLVSSRGAQNAVGERGMYNAGSDSNNRVALMIFDDNTHLMGYFIGSPTNLGGGKWQMDVVNCDYDFTHLYEAELAAFEGNWEEDFSTYIPPEEIESSGAVWFLNGYNTGRGPVLREDDAQIYALWHTLHGPELARQCREIERLEESLPRKDRWMCYLLLDQDYNLLGYTMLDYQGNGG